MTASEPDRKIAAAAGIVVGVSLYAVVGALVSLAGWTFDVPRLADWGSNGIATLPNTAVALAATGLSLAFARVERYRAARNLAVLPTLLAILTLIEHLSGVNLGIDTLILPNRVWGVTATVTPGRMGPPASLALTLLGAGLLILSSGRGRRYVPWLGAAAAAVALLTMTGYIFGAALLYTVPRVTGIAWQTATMLLGLGVGLACATPEQEPIRTLQEDSSAGELARRALPAIIILPLLLGSLVVRGQEAGLYDSGMGTALLVFVLIALLCWLLGWGTRTVGARERSLAAEVAERQRLQGEIEQRKQEVATLVENSPDVVFRLDASLRHLYINPAVTRTTGLQPEHFIGKTAREAGIPEDLAREIERHCREALKTGEPESVEFSYETPQGLRHFQTQILPEPHGPTGRATLLGVSTDVTELREAAAALRETDRRKTEFLAVLAHEIRNPLAPLRHAVELLRDRATDPAAIAELQGMMERQLSQVVRLVDDLLDVSRITRDRLELRRQRVMLGEAVAYAVETCRPVADSQGQTLSVSLPEEPLYVDADRARLSQVFGNLLMNACKYTNRGGSIWLSVSRNNGEAVVSVRDNGIGIPAHMLPRVFEMFTQVDQAQERAQGGLGIGLTLVSRLVTLHGGRVEARSGGPGQGSEFIVRLPLDQSAPEPSVEPPRSAAARPRPRRVLVVDDNIDAARMLGMLLKTQGHQVALGHNGEEAVALATSFQPQVALLDIGMPKLDGYDACRAIRRLPGGDQIRIVALTGWGQEEDLAKSQAAGFDGHLVKPLEFRILSELLAEFDQMEESAATG
jgi:PAS domain S-box-containing protein